MTRAPRTIEISAGGLTVTAPSPGDPDIHRGWGSGLTETAWLLRMVWPVMNDRHGNPIRGLDIERLSLLKYSGEFPWSF